MRLQIDMQMEEDASELLAFNCKEEKFDKNFVISREKGEEKASMSNSFIIVVIKLM